MDRYTDINTFTYAYICNYGWQRGRDAAASPSAVCSLSGSLTLLVPAFHERHLFDLDQFACMFVCTYVCIYT